MLGAGQKRVALSTVDPRTVAEYSCEIADLVLDLTPRIQEDLERPACWTSTGRWNCR